ncbi:baseplate J/gp47 family protein [Paenibacillus ehimensis]|uniref:baseplate J/gp47 family protein n=1 Tax=Paenibacillus ehimensis TaxID=79264 RepID=UPI0013E3A28B|nr:baseplate J/gp47 family protein [Paenibacillus ehimensis]
MDEDLIQAKTEDELMEEAKQQLRDQQFPARLLRKGGVFYTLLALFFRALAALYGLLPVIVQQMFVHSATGKWLDVAAREYGVFRKQATKTTGKITFTRTDTSQRVIIPAGSVFSTDPDLDGNERRFYLKENIVLPVGVAEVEGEIEAEEAGAAYNVAAGMIRNMLTFVPYVTVTNGENWLVREGTDEESDEDLRERTLNRWEQLSTGGIRDYYRSLVESINGVVAVHIEDQHPRGEGTADIIITSVAGVPSSTIVQEAQDLITQYGSLIGDIQAFAAEPVQINIDVVLHYDSEYAESEEIRQVALLRIQEMFRYGAEDRGDGILHINPRYPFDVSLIYANLRTIPNVIQVDVLQPTSTVVTTRRQVAVLGTVNIQVVA